MFALVVDGDVVAVADTLPNAARVAGSRAWVRDLVHASTEVRASCGWHTVTATPRPPSTAATTHDRTVELVDGVPTVVWVERQWTSGELADSNGDTIRRRALEALDANRMFLAASSPTAAQTLAQVRSMARQMNGLIRLTLGALDGTD